MKKAKYETMYPLENMAYMRVFADLFRIAEQGGLKGKNVVIFGAVFYLNELREMLRTLGSDISYVIDSNESKTGHLAFGIEIRSLESLTEVKNKDSIVVIIASVYYSAMSMSLKKMGFIQDRNFFIVGVDAEFHFLSGYYNRFKFALSAYLYYRKLERECKGAPMRLIHMPCLGDVYIASLFLPAAEKAENVRKSECVLIVTRNVCKKVGNLFGYKDIKIISDVQASKLLFLMGFLHGRLNIKNMLYHGTLLSAITPITFYGKSIRFVNFVDFINIGAYNLDGRPAMVMPEFPVRRDIIDALFESNHLVKGKTVLISPYSSHFAASITEEVWQIIVTRLKEKGYSVATNCAGEAEAPLPGTVPLLVEIQDSVAFLESAGYFIGIRSGLCDVISSAACTKLIIYEKGLSLCDINYFGFKAMGIADDMIEIVSDGKDMEAFINNVLGNF